MMLANGSVKCDTCGKLSRHPFGEYCKPDGTAGYIRPADPQQMTAEDICEECAERSPAALDAAGRGD